MIYVPLIVAVVTLVLLGRTNSIVGAYLHIGIAILASMIVCVIVGSWGSQAAGGSSPRAPGTDDAKD